MRALLLKALTVGLVFLTAAGATAQKTDKADAPGDPPLPAGAVARLGSLRLWQRSNIASVAISPDGKTAATGSSWLHRRTGPGSSSGYGESRVRLWEVATGKLLHNLEAPGLIFGLSFAPDGKRLAAGCGQEIRLWNVADGKLLQRFGGHQKPSAMVGFSRDGQQLFSVASDTSWGRIFDQGDDTEMLWWEVASAKKLRTLKGSEKGDKDEGGLEALAVSPDGKVLLKVFRKNPQGKLDRSLRAFDTTTGALLFQQPLSDQAEVRVLAFSPDGKRFARSDRVIWIEDAGKGFPLGKIERPPGSLTGLAFAPDGKKLAASYYDGAVVLWDAATGKQLREFQVGRSPPFYQALPPTPVAAVFSKDGRLLAGADGGSLRLWDAATGKELPDLPGHRAPVFHVHFTADGQIIVSACKQRLCRWEAASGKEIGQVSRAGLEPSANHIAVSWDGTLVLARTQRGGPELRAVAGGKVLRVLAPKDQYIQNAFFSTDDKRLIVLARAGDAVQAYVYETATGKEVGQVEMARDKDEATTQVHSFYPADRGPVVSPDGKYLAWTGVGGSVYLGDLATGKVVRHLDVNRVRREKHEAVPPALLIFSPDSWQLANVPSGGQPGQPGIVDEDRTISLWEVASGKLRQRLRVRQQDGNPALLACASYSPDGRTLAVGTHDDGRVGIWEVASGQERRIFQGHEAAVLSLACAPDGKRLASSSDDGTVLLWDVRGRGAGPALAKREVLWTRLSGDAAVADQAIRDLLQTPTESVAFLKEQVRPAVGVEPGRVAKLVADLANERFTVRARATAELERLRDLAEPALAEALPRATNLEARRRIERLLEATQAATPGRLRELRALEVLEQIGTAEARQVLETLAGGTAASRLTREAEAALGRLGRRAPTRR
jgi:WD40 repeat protein